MKIISNKNIAVSILLVVFYFLSGCGGGDDPSPHDSSDSVTLSGFNSAGFYQQSGFDPASVEAEAIVASYGQFVDALFDRYGEPRHSPDTSIYATNLIYNPYNLYETLNQMKEGAAGEILDKLPSLTFTTLNQGHASASWNAISQDIIQRNPFAPVQRVNRLWGQQRYRFSTRFLEEIAKYYDAQITGLDFFGNANAAIDAITLNHTDFLIQNFLEDEILPRIGKDLPTRMVTENGTALTVDWRSLAGRITTQEGTFTPYGDNTRRQSRMLFYSGPVFKRQSEKHETVSLPLDSNGLDLVIITPNTGRDALELVGNLSVEWLKQEVDSLVAADATIAIPLLRINNNFAIQQLFKPITPENTFLPNEDFSRVNNVGFLKIEDTWHSSIFEFSEQGVGTEALTLAIYNATEGEPIELFPVAGFYTLDRDAYFSGLIGSYNCYLNPSSSKPFLFFIYDKVLGIPLIYGQVMTITGDSVPFDGSLLPIGSFHYSLLDELNSSKECIPLNSP